MLSRKHFTSPHTGSQLLKNVSLKTSSFKLKLISFCKVYSSVLTKVKLIHYVKIVKNEFIHIPWFKHIYFENFYIYCDYINTLGYERKQNAYIVLFLRPDVVLLLPLQKRLSVVLLFYVHGKHLRSCREGQLT